MLVEIGEFVKAVAPAATAAAAATATWIGYKGLTKWQTELLGKRKTELAEEALADFYQMQDIMRAVRSPVGWWGAEGLTRKAGTNESPEQKHKLDQAFSTIERYNKHSEFHAEFRAKRYRMRALFGASADEAYLRMNEAVGTVLGAAQMLMLSASSMADLTGC
jgi:hypothetical protein